MAWRAMDPLSAISDDSSSGSDSEKDEEAQKPVAGDAVASQKGVEKQEGGKDSNKGELDYEALSRHGYSGGPSILYVPPPKHEAAEQDWSWSTGKRKNDQKQEEETIEERELTREKAKEETLKMAAEALAESAYAKKQKRDAIAEQRALSFSQKEKRKRDLGQSSRGKNYVEEEKRLLRDSGVYSGFDT